MRDIFFPIREKKRDPAASLPACPAASEVFNRGCINIYARARAESRLHPNTYVTVRNDISSIAVFMKRSYAE